MKNGNTGAPRRFLGGHSKTRRRPDRPVQAPPWTDAAAWAARQSLDEARGQEAEASYLVRVGRAGCISEAWKQALRRHKMMDEQRTVVESVLNDYFVRIAALTRAANFAGAATAAASMLRSLRRRTRGIANVQEIVLPLWDGKPTRSLASLLSTDASADRVRSTDAWALALPRLAAWPDRPTVVPTVVQPEAARRRVLHERGGVADSAFMRGCEHQLELPTLTGSRSGHWFWLHLLRPVSVEETVRACGCEATARPAPDAPRAEEPLMLALGCLSPTEAVSCLGRSVHMVSARCVLQRLLTHRSPARLGQRLSYASAFSGVDTVAVALDGLVGPTNWNYEFLAEINDTVRAAATAAWSTRGLDARRAHADAREIHCEAWAEMFVWTAECNEFSAKNQGSTYEGQAKSLHDMSLALRYVHLQRPHLMLVENIDNPDVCIPISGMLGSLRGYSVERLVICPARHAGWPCRRLRSFWLCWRTDLSL